MLERARKRKAVLCTSHCKLKSLETHLKRSFESSNDLQAHHNLRCIIPLSSVHVSNKELQTINIKDSGGSYLTLTCLNSFEKGTQARHYSVSLLSTTRAFSCRQSCLMGVIWQARACLLQTHVTSANLWMSKPYRKCLVGFMNTFKLL